jgi:hypothetical protein
MNRFLSITNHFFLFLLGAYTTVFAQSLELPVIRQKGSSLDTSISQEADHSMRLAREWLRKNPPAHTETQTCALVQLALDHTEVSTNLIAWATTSGLSARTNQVQDLLVACITNYPPLRCEPEPLWLLSRTINQYHQGILLRNTEALDWRNDFANLLICSLRRNASGGAYWEASRLDPVAPKSTPESLMTARIRATAYGILALKEIHE